MAGTFTVTSNNKNTILDTDCIVSTITYKTPPNVYEIAGYSAVPPFLPTAGRFTLIDGTPPDGQVFYNLDPYTNWPWVLGQPVTITPVPPTPVKRVASLWCSAIPDGAEFTIVTL
jgi:hypothetical protein